MKSIIISTIFYLGITCFAFGGSPHLELCIPGQERASDETCLVDGDTLWLNGVNIRLKDFDTPEPQSRICGGQKERDLAHQASQRLLEILNTNDWDIQAFGKENNGSGKRTLGTIFVDGRDVGDILIEERLARRWPDGDEWWCK